MTDTHVSTVIELICKVGGLSHLEPDQDYFDAGVTSVMALPLLLEVEDRFQVSLPDDQFIAVRTARSLSDLVRTIENQEADA